MAAHALGLMTSKMANRLVIAAVLSVAVAEDAKKVRTSIMVSFASTPQGRQRKSVARFKSARLRRRGCVKGPRSVR